MRALILALFACVAASAVLAQEDAPGVDRWPVKIAPPLPGPATPIPIESLIALPDAPGVGHNDARYQAARIPGQLSGNPGWFEGSNVQTTGWLCLVASEDDGDDHIQLAASPDCASPVLIVEVPSPDFITDPTLKAQASAVRALIRDQVFRGREPARGGSLVTPAVRVTVSGALFFDDAHVGDQPRGKRGMKAPDLWELHPVTSITLTP